MKDEQEQDSVSDRAVGRMADIQPDMSCALSVQDLVRLKQEPDTVLIDVRTADAIPLLDLPGVMRMPASAVSNKAYLRNKRIVLVGDGLAQQALFEQCAHIKVAGIKSVFVLNGGAPQWRLRHALLATSSAVAPDTLNLSATDLWAESLFGANLVLSLPHSRLQTELPFSMTVHDFSEQTIRQALEKRTRSGVSRTLASVVLAMASTDSTSVARIAAIRQSLFPLPVLTYVGGLQDLKDHLVQQQATWRARDHGPKQPRCGM